MPAPVKSTRQRAIEAAIAVVADGGMEMLTMRAVADATGVTATALYRHFEDKSRLVAAVLSELNARFQDYVAFGFARTDPVDKLLGVIVAARSFAIDHPRFYQALFLHNYGSTPPVYPDGFHPPPRSIRELVDVVQQCMTHGFLQPDDPVDIALLLTAQLHGLLRFWFMGRFGNDREVFEAFCDDSFARVLRGLTAT